MKLTEIFTRKRIMFILLFAILSFIGYKLNFSSILGAKQQYFTFFQFFGPMTGAFLGPVFGVIAVFLAEISNYFILGKAFDFIGLWRLTPMLFAAAYFGIAGNKKFKEMLQVKALMLLIPLIAIALFVLHPVGSQVWFYSMYWLIPIAAFFFAERFVFLKSLGATFTAHAIGSIIFLYTIPTQPALWLTLIPIVIFERTMFALGITASYITVNSVLARINTIASASEININLRYVLGMKKTLNA